MAIDLHCHTKLSDGSLGIEEVLGLAKRRGVHTLSITDHDTVAASTRAVMIGKRQGLKVIHGVELTAWDTARDRMVHILCYMSEYPDRLEGLCRRTCEARKKAALETLKKVMRYFPITPEMVMKHASGSVSIYSQHIMHALMDAGYTDRIFGTLYQKLLSRDHGVARVKEEFPDVYEVLDAIDAAGGVPVLAHPYGYHSEDLMQELAEKKRIRGIEVFYPAHTEQQIGELLDFAKINKLIVTGGSDFHGMYSHPAHPLACASLPDEYLSAVLNGKPAKV